MPNPSTAAPPGPPSAHPTLAGVQALRALACLMVVAYHTLQAGLGEQAVAAWPNLSAGVDIFFLISGFVMAGAAARAARGARPARQFLASRIRRIVPLYWKLSAAKLALALCLPALAAQTAPTLWNAVASFLFIPARNALGVVRPVLPVGWTLEFEALFYLLVAGCLALRLRLASVLLPLGAIALAGFWRTPDWPAPAVLLNSLVLEFALGMCLAWQAPALRQHCGKLPACLLAGAGFLFLLMLPLAGAWRFAVWGLPAAAMLAAALSQELALARRIPSWLLKIGDSSYAIYLVHPFVVPALARHGLALAAIPGSIIAGYFTNQLLDPRVTPKALPSSEAAPARRGLGGGLAPQP